MFFEYVYRHITTRHFPRYFLSKYHDILENVLLDRFHCHTIEIPGFKFLDPRRLRTDRSGSENLKSIELNSFGFVGHFSVCTSSCLRGPGIDCRLWVNSRYLYSLELFSQYLGWSEGGHTSSSSRRVFLTQISPSSSISYMFPETFFRTNVNTG